VSIRACKRGPGRCWSDAGHIRPTISPQAAHSGLWAFWLVAVSPDTAQNQPVVRPNVGLARQVAPALVRDCPRLAKTGLRVTSRLALKQERPMIRTTAMVDLVYGGHVQD